ncbi:PD-(D/E)XK nuclease family protein [Deinococcus yavapaiensis]|uniref:ATP-dependent helicase/DNAse subunit B n=1 Tax=Deinococcus yavapaiensis KR-236 TaxID=694435 RepID=A0A318SIH1_9DEIO|nr:UrvD/REP family ATP-dependent DNA helicase [Deinococcus yavapaiensis]PYE53857.1 ATP-dependent helicase/DNAse subunit B [Deinococcus yavapaiensis KR-236]
MLRTLLLSSAAPPVVHGELVTLNRRAAARYGRAATPLSSFARTHLTSRGIEVASPVLAHRLLTDAVSIELGAAAPSGSARTFGPAVRELLRLEVDLDALARDDVPRVRDVARVAARYRSFLRGESVVDGAEVLAVAARTIERGGPLTLFGYVRLTLDERRFLDAFAGDGSVVCLPWTPHRLFTENEEAGAWLEARGWTVQFDAPPLPDAANAFLGGGLAKVRARSSAHREEEVRAALSEIRDLLKRGVPVSDVALVVADDAAWGPLVQAVAWEYDLDVDVTASVPLGETRVGSWLRVALEVVERGPAFERVARLLGHPLDVGVEPHAWRALRSARPDAFDGWSEAGVDLSAFAWPAQATRAAWTARVTNLLEARDVEARARARGSLDEAALDALTGEVRALARPAEELVSREAFLEEVRTLLSLLAVAPQASGQALELLTPYAVIGARVPHVFILGLVEGEWPAPLADDPLLDFIERRRLNASGVPLEVPASLARRDALSFWSLLCAASGTLTGSHARQGQSGGEGLPSSYLTRLTTDIEAHERRTPCSEEEARRVSLDAADDVTAFARHALDVERRRETATTFDAFDGLTGLSVAVTERVYSASELRVLGTCAFRWWLSYELRVDVTDENDDESLGLGRLRHETMRLLALRAQARPGEDARSVMLGALEGALREAEERLGWPRTPLWDVQRLEELTRLRRALSAPKFLAPNARIALVEAPFEGAWYGLRVRGVVDRVDDLGRAVAIVDYKSGSSKPPGAQDTDGKLGLDVQLPIYQQTALPALMPGRPPGGARYVSLSTGDNLGQLRLGDAALEAFANRVKHALEGGAFPPRPDAARKACERCPYPAVCRAGPRLARKEPA